VKREARLERELRSLGPAAIEITPRRARPSSSSFWASTDTSANHVLFPRVVLWSEGRVKKRIMSRLNIYVW
jgi:hypothetical protein